MLYFTLILPLFFVVKLLSASAAYFQVHLDGTNSLNPDQTAYE